MRPNGSLGPSKVRCLAALFYVYKRDGKATIRDVAAVFGRNLSTTANALETLRHAGLVTWEPGQSATLRPTVEALAVHPFGATIGTEKSGGRDACDARPPGQPRVSEADVANDTQPPRRVQIGGG